MEARDLRIEKGLAESNSDDMKCQCGEDGSDPQLVPLAGATFMKIVADKQDPSEEVLTQLDHGGIQKSLTILFRPAGGDRLYFYDEKLHIIQDVMSLYMATHITFTNQVKKQDALEGTCIARLQVRVRGRPSYFDELELRHSGGSYTFKDEYSFWAWGAQNRQLNEVVAVLR